ncbi:D-hexose-6-phosphate mutarotase [Herbaspirillum sp. RV1423]|uniref:D-hexose-6-phosphate mutarotase n=1 Tax=Herbaspirillum sp. RV1423 TaxID=1443993 RepID=UPI000557E55B|nr:D-hexose-6-phosphate mutarotase [Herbaspirillum sp. RV1423]
MPTSMLPDVAGLLHLTNTHGDSAAISLYGAQLLSWTTADGREHLYCTPHSTVGAGAAIRGGVPVCFPQFSGRGALPKHGLVRNLVWHIDGDVLSGADQDVACARLSLYDTAATRALWPHGFALQLQVELGAGWLSVALNVTNTGDAAFDFTAALHTYLATPDVRNAGVEQLGNARFIDTTVGNDESRHNGAALRIADETDNVYLSPPAALALHQDGKPFLQLEQQGFADSVIWNPGPAKAAQLGDMPTQDWTRMLCIEAAQIEHPVRLSPQATWRGLQRLTRAR